MFFNVGVVNDANVEHRRDVIEGDVRGIQAEPRNYAEKGEEDVPRLQHFSQPGVNVIKLFYLSLREGQLGLFAGFFRLVYYL